MNNKCTDQTARMRRLIRAFDARKHATKFYCDVAHSQPDILFIKCFGHIIKCMLINRQGVRECCSQQNIVQFNTFVVYSKICLNRTNKGLKGKW